MASIHPQQVPVKPGESKVEQQLRSHGFVPGAPSHLTAFAQRIDQGLCSGLVCGGCHVRGLNYRPFHKGRAYRLAAVCPRCGHGEEV